MKSAVLKVLIGSSLLVGSALLSAQQVIPTIGGGLVGTAHDFTTITGDAMVGLPTVPIGLCTYCHTPHKAQSTLLLWNHTLSTNSFKWDVPSTTAGTAFPTIVGNTYKGPTAKCLSCHDGSVAVGDVAWYKEAARTGAAALTGNMMGTVNANAVVGGAGSMSGNHPVAMPYPFNNAGSTYNASSNGSMLQTADWVADPTQSTTAHIRLFNDDGTGVISAGAVATKTGIECSSCHDPHNKATVDSWFLRGKVAGSQVSDGYICVQCHKK